MSDQYTSESPEALLSADGDRIGPLLRLAGPREAVPADRMRRVKAAVHAEWRQQTRARSRRTTVGWSVGALAAAALVLLSVRVAVRDAAPVASPPQALATVDAVSGAVRLVPSSERGAGGPTLFQVGDHIRVGDGVDTTSGGVAALRLAGGASVRIDRGTRVRVLSGATLVLDEGAIYVDSGAGQDALPRDAPSLEVRTAVGLVRDIGTQFEVRLLSGSALRVRVRDGLVRLSQSRRTHDATPGDELTLDGNGSVIRRTVPVYGADWAWAAALARPFELEGQSLRDFLDWIVGENGWQLRFADAAVEQTSLTTVLHGSIQGLTPEEALAAVLPTVGVEHRLENGVLLIRLSAGGTKN
jgi:hypothetical protein